MRNDTPRQIVRSRTTMSYAFEAAIRRLLAEEGSLNSRRGDIANMAAQVLHRGTRKAPTWTVTKRERRR